MNQKERAKKKFELWREHPEVFITKVLGTEKLEDYQVRLIQTVAKNKYTTIRSCHATGKTFTLGRLVLWFYSVYPNSIVISTAPTYTQVEALLWGEIREAFKKSKYPLGGKLLQTKLTKSDKWFCLGASTQKKLAIVKSS